MRRRKKSGASAGISRSQASLFILVLSAEALFHLIVMGRGRGEGYLLIIAVLIPLTMLILYLTCRFKASLLFAITVIYLCNFGFAVQLIASEKDRESLISMDWKLLIGVALALVFSFIYSRWSYLMGLDLAILGLIIIQMGLCLMILLFGRRTGGDGVDSAILKIVIGGLEILPFEFVKVIYIFVFAGLMTKDEKIESRFLFLNREAVLVLYTVVLTILPGVLCSDFGFVLIILITGILLYIIFASDRKRTKSVLFFLFEGGLIASLLVILVPIGPLLKIKQRFLGFLHPFSQTHYLKIREALTLGGFTGAETDRYLMKIPVEESDTVFAKLVECMGVSSGLLVMLGLVVLLAVGFRIAWLTRDSYYKGIAMGFSVLIAIQSMIHVAYNCGIAPITGITLYYVSSGFSSLTAAMVIAAVMLVISAGNQMRSVYDETDGLDITFNKRQS